MSYDIHFQIIPESEQINANSRVFSFGFKSAVGIKGPQRLINRWLKCLFTTKGTDLFNATYGTGFTGIFGSNISERRDFVDMVSIFINDCSEQITALDNENFPPDDERLDSAVLTSVVPRGNDGYDVYVNLKNVAGTVVTVLLPTG